MLIEPGRYYLTKNKFRCYVGYSLPGNESYFYIGHIKGNGMGPTFAAKWDEAGYIYDGCHEDFDIAKEITLAEYLKSLEQHMSCQIKGE